MSIMIEQFIEKGFGWTVPSPNSQKCYRRHIARFETFLKSREKTTETVTDQDIVEHIEQLKSKYKPNTVAANVAAIKSYFKWLTKQGLTHQPVIRSQRSIKITHKTLSDSDLDAIIKRLDGDECFTKRNLAMFALAINCDFKTEEVVAINVEDINFKNLEITIKKRQRSFRAAFKEVKAYADAKLQKESWIGTEGKEPFFINRHRLRISSRSMRRRIMGDTSAYNMRDLRHSYKGKSAMNSVA